MSSVSQIPLNVECYLHFEKRRLQSTGCCMCKSGERRFEMQKKAITSPGLRGLNTNELYCSDIPKLPPRTPLASGAFGEIVSPSNAGRSNWKYDKWLRRDVTFVLSFPQRAQRGPRATWPARKNARLVNPIPRLECYFALSQHRYRTLLKMLVSRRRRSSMVLFRSAQRPARKRDFFRDTLYWRRAICELSSGGVSSTVQDMQTKENASSPQKRIH